MDEHPERIMQCMEVWGGNQNVDGGVVMAGLDAWVYSRPYGEADGGGDLHYVSSCATGRITRLLLADVSGHGEAVATTAKALRGLMRRFVNYIDQTSFVRAMNEQFSALSETGYFATAVVTTFFAPTNELSVCNAGHPPPLAYRRKQKKWGWLDVQPDKTRDDAADNIPLGIIDGTQYAQFDVRLDVGDMVLCYTDSLIEAHDADGQLLGKDGLLRIVRSLDISDPARMIGQLLERIAAEAPDNLTEDDVTVLLFRPNGLAPKVPLGKRAAAPFRLFGAIARGLLPGGPPIPWPEFSLRNLGVGVFDRKPRA